MEVKGNFINYGSYVDVHDVEVVNLSLGVAEMHTQAPDNVKITPEEPTGKPAAEGEQSEEQLFKFIHPSITGEQERVIHDEVRNLVKRHGVQEICQYLKTMAAEKKILLPQMPSTAYAELVRMGMPNGEGFSEKYFTKHYNK